MTIEITEEQELLVKEFLEKHKTCKHKRFAPTHSYIITPGGIGYCMYVRCNACEEQENITDYDNW